MRIYKILAAALAAFILKAMPGLAADAIPAKTNGDLIVQFHFVGIQQIAADPKAANLKEIGALPVTAALRDKTLDKLASAPYHFLKRRIDRTTTNDYSGLIRPMLDDLLRDESYVEMRDTTNPVPEFMLAVRMGNDRANLWQTYLAAILESWTNIRIKHIQGDGFTGWELIKHHDPNVIRCLRAGDWLLFGWGWNELYLQPIFLERIKTLHRPFQTASPDWIDLVVDCPTIQAHHAVKLPFPLPPKLPKLHLTVQGRTNYIRPQLVMQFREPINLKLDPWQLPKKELPDQFVSFSIARGIAPWLNSLPQVQALHLDTVPNQMAVWSIRSVPFETGVSFPMANASNYLAGVAPQLAAMLNSNLDRTPLKSAAMWKNNVLRITEIPFISPYLQAVHEPEGEFLLAGLFPHVPTTNSQPLPDAMLREINSKPNLVYGDWEKNQQRMEQWRLLLQTYLMGTGKMLPSQDMPAQKWLETAKTKLGDCGTEVLQTAPDELTLIRNSAVGFTGFEMNLLAYWLDGEDFPFSPHYDRSEVPIKSAAH